MCAAVPIDIPALGAVKAEWFEDGVFNQRPGKIDHLSIGLRGKDFATDLDA
jgi:hypothetical protein